MFVKIKGSYSMSLHSPRDYLVNTDSIKLVDLNKHWIFLYGDTVALEVEEGFDALVTALKKGSN